MIASNTMDDAMDASSVTALSFTCHFNLSHTSKSNIGVAVCFQREGDDKKMKR